MRIVDDVDFIGVIKVSHGELNNPSRGERLDDLAKVRLIRSMALKKRLSFSLFLLLVLVLLKDIFLPGRAIVPSLSIPGGSLSMLPSAVMILALIMVLLLPYLGMGRSPHSRYYASGGGGLGSLLGEERLAHELQGMIDQLRWHQEITKELGGNVPKGVLFEGPPGTGKTMAARAIAQEISVPFLVASASSFQSMYYGQTNRKIRSFFRSVRKAADKSGGAIGFIDEIDAIGATRSSMGSGSVREGVTGVVTELLVQLQSFDSPSGLHKLSSYLSNSLPSPVVALWRRLFPELPKGRAVFIAATNRATELDPALVRPGRFDRRVNFDLPTTKKRELILLGLLADRPASKSALASVAMISSQTAGMSHAGVARLVEEAAGLAWRRGSKVIDDRDLWDALATTRIGIAEGSPYPPEQRMRIAVHESGHAVAGWYLSGVGQVELLSIYKRGAALGLTARMNDKDQFLFTESQLRSEISVALAGMCAEEILLGEASSGGASDLERATEVAVQMVGRFGLGDSLISFAVVGSLGLNAATLSDTEARKQVDAVLNSERNRTTELLIQHRDDLDRLVWRLLAKEEMDHKEIEEVLGVVEPRRVDISTGSDLKLDLD